MSTETAVTASAWYEKHVVGIQTRSEGGRVSGWRDFPGGPMTIREAQTAFDDGVVELCQAREEGRNLLIAVPRKSRVVRPYRRFGIGGEAA